MFVNNPNELDQHFLIDKDIINSFINICNLSEDDIVLEIGPGIGTLTKLIAPKVKKLYVIEKDIRLKPYLDKIDNIQVMYDSCLNVNFPKSSPSPIFMITLNIDTNTIGTTNIFNRSINPEPNNPYHLVTSCNQVTSAGFSGSPATNCIITPNISPIIVAYIVLVENLTFFFSNCLTIKNVPISTAIKITVFKSVILRNCDKNELSPIL